MSNVTDFQDRQARFAEWSGMLTWGLIGLAVVLVVSVAVLIFKSSNEEALVEANRKSWDHLYDAVKEKKPAELIKAYEGVLPQVKGSTAYPYAVLQIAHEYYQESIKPEKPMAERKEKLGKSNQLYNQLLSEFADHALYGAIAADSAALTSEQLGNSDEAISTLDKAVDKYDKHFLAPKLNYELARMLWLRSLRGGANAEADRTKAERTISRAVPKENEKEEFTRVDYSMVSDFREFQNIPYIRAQWQRDALLLKALLDKPGPGLPNGQAPAERPETTRSNTPATPPAQPGQGFVPPVNPTDLLNRPNQPNNAPAFPAPVAPNLNAPAPAPAPAPALPKP